MNDTPEYVTHTTYAGNDLIDGEVVVYVVMHGDQAIYASLDSAMADAVTDRMNGQAS